MVALYDVATASPSRFQFEDNSGTLACSQTNNCGPTCITKIAQFYKGTWYGIEATRTLAVGRCVPTSAWDQRDMLSARGIPADAYGIDTLSQLHGIVDSGRRPVVIGVEMLYVPVAYRDHGFLGWHAICLMDGSYLDGERGFFANDPNFSPAGGHRPDPDKGRKWYPDWVIQSAFLNRSPRWSVVPTNAKPILSTKRYATVAEGARLRQAPNVHSDLRRVFGRNTRCLWLDDVRGGAYDYWNGNRWVHSKWNAPNGWSKVRSPDGMGGYVFKPQARLLSGTEMRAAVEEPLELDAAGLGLRVLSKAEASDFVNDPVTAEIHNLIDPNQWEDSPDA